MHEFHRQFCQVTLQPLFEPFDGPRGSGAGFGAVCGQEFFTMPGDEVTSGNGWHSYWKSPFIVNFPIKNGDFP